MKRLVWVNGPGSSFKSRSHASRRKDQWYSVRYCAWMSGWIAQIGARMLNGGQSYPTREAAQAACEALEAKLRNARSQETSEVVPRKERAMKRLTCGCCDQGCICWHHQDTPNEKPPHVCPAHAPEPADPQAAFVKSCAERVGCSEEAVRRVFEL